MQIVYHWFDKKVLKSHGARTIKSHLTTEAYLRTIFFPLLLFGFGFAHLQCISTRVDDLKVCEELLMSLREASAPSA